MRALVSLVKSLTPFHFFSRVNSSTIKLGLIAGLLLFSAVTNAAVNFTVPATDSDGTFTISWSGVRTYIEIYERQGTSGSWGGAIDGASSSGSKTITKPLGSTWQYYIKDCLIGNMGAASCVNTSTRTITLTAITIPSTPSLSVPATDSNGSYTVSWSSETGAATYTLQERTGSGSWSTIHNTAATSKGISGKSSNTYAYRVRACGSAGCSSYTAQQQVVVTIAPPPGSLSVSYSSPVQSGGNFSFTMSWTGVRTYMEIYERQGTSGSWGSAIDGSSSSGSKTITKFLGTTWQHYAKDCWVDGGTGATLCNNTPTHTVTLAAPIPPTPSLTVPSTDSDGSYPVSWTSTTGATSYTLQERTGSGSWSTLQNNSSTSRNISGKSSNTYRYRVRACNSGGCSSYSTQRQIVVSIPVPIPSSPALTLASTDSDGNYPVSWTSTTGATSYRLQERTGSGSWTTLQNNSSTSRNISGKGSNTYRYRVRACNSSGCSSYSTQRQIVVNIPSPIPDTPALSVAATDADGNYTISWSAETGATSYGLQERTGSGSWSTIQSIASTSKTISGKSSNTYGYRVRACAGSGLGCSPYSAQQQIIVNISPPSANLSVSYSTPVQVGGNFTFTITWTGVRTFMEIHERQGTSGSWGNVTGSSSSGSHVITKPLGSTWQFRGRDCWVNEADMGQQVCVFTPTQTVTFAGPTPSIPATLTVPAADADGNYSVSWSSVTGATFYELREQIGSGAWTTIYNQAITTKTISGKNSNTYRYKVRACAGSSTNCSSDTAVKQVAVTIAPPPQSLEVSYSNPVQVGGNFTFTVTWTGVRTFMEIHERQGTSGSWGNVTGSSSSGLHSITKPLGSTWQFRGRDCWVNEADMGQQVCVFTPIRTMTIAAPTPDIPGGLTVPATDADGNYLVSWSFVTGATFYELREQVGNGVWTIILDEDILNKPISGKGSNTYRYKVRACADSSANCSLDTAVQQVVVTIGEPPASLELSHTPPEQVGENFTSTISWTGIRTYMELHEREGTSGAWDDINGSTTGESSGSMIITKPLGSTWQYRGRDCWVDENDMGQQLCVYTTPPETVTLAAATPDVPEALTVPPTSNSGNYSVSWSFVTGATFYELQEQEGNSNWSDSLELQDEDSTSADISGNSSNTYSYRVRACAGSNTNCSPYTAPQQIDVNIPVNFTVEIVDIEALPNNEDFSFTINWAGADTYVEIYEREQGEPWPINAIDGSNDNSSSGTRTYTKPSSTTWQYRLKNCTVVEGNMGPLTTCEESDILTATLDGNIVQIFTEGTDVGNVNASGYYSFNDATGNYVVAGSGSDIWGGSDEFYYNYTEITGDFEVIAKVDVFDVDNGWGKAGFMVRQSLTGASIHASMFLTNTHGVAMQSRSIESSSSAGQTVAGYIVGTWLRLVRTGDVLIGYASIDGNDWIEIQSRTINLSNTVYLGFAVTAHQDGSLGTAQFSQLSLENTPSTIENQAPLAADDEVPANQDSDLIVSFANLLNNDTDPDGDLLSIIGVSGGVNGQVILNGSDITFTPNVGFSGVASFVYEISDGNGGTDTAEVTVAVAPPTGQNIVQIFDQGTDVGNVQAAGNYTFDSATGNYVVEGSGSDIWSSNDEFYYNYTEVTGDFEAIAKVDSFDVNDGWGKAGFMLREGLTNTSIHASMFLTNNYGAAFQSRAIEASSSGSQRVGNYSVGIWLRLVRAGNTLTGYASTDGSNWEEVGSRSISFSSTAYLGFAVTAHQDGAIGSAQFSHLTLIGGGLTFSNQAPGISSIEDQTLLEGQLSTGEIGFVVTDLETPSANLSIVATSSNISVISNADIVIIRDDAVPRIEVFSSTGEVGSADITITVTDADGASASTVFTVTVGDGGSGGENILPPYEGNPLATIADPLTDPLTGGIYSGALTGSYTVESDASFNYSIPISLPSGINGLTPSVDLNYSSSIRNNIAGWGWSILGFSKIHRCASDYIRDESASGVHDNANYKYCMNGERLVQVSGNTYKTESESHLRITYEDPYWVVTDSNGDESRYGFNSDAQERSIGNEITTWHLDRMSDIHDNYYTVAYQAGLLPGGPYHRPDSIAYTQNDADGNIPEHKVQFEYETRPDVITRLEGQTRRIEDKRLSNIRVFSQNELLWSYHLTYQVEGNFYHSKRYEDPAQISRLASIERCIQNGGTQVCQDPIEFDWSETNEAKYVYVPRDIPATEPPSSFEDRVGEDKVVLDADHDGEYEAYYFTENNELKLFPAPWGSPNYQQTPKHEYSIEDVNGDGYKDVIQTNALISGVNVFLNIENPSAQGDDSTRIISEFPDPAYSVAMEEITFNATRTYFHFEFGDSLEQGPDTTKYTMQGVYGYDIHYADLNSDGLLDLIRVPPMCGAGAVRCSFVDPNPAVPYTEGNQNLDPNNTIGYPKDISVVFNTGSGWAQASGGVAFDRWNNNWEWDNKKQESSIFFTDINHDGALDIIATTASEGPDSIPVTTRFLHNGKYSFGEGEFTPAGNLPSTANRKIAGDFNGDGTTDYAVVPIREHWRRPEPENDNLSVFLGNGLGVDDGHIALGNARVLDYCGRNRPEGSRCRMIAVDFNNDGYDDIAQLGSCGSPKCEDFRVANSLSKMMAQVWISKGGNASGEVTFADPILYRDSDVFSYDFKFKDYNNDGMKEDNRDSVSQLKEHRIEKVIVVNQETISVNYKTFDQTAVVLSSWSVSGDPILDDRLYITHDVRKTRKDRPKTKTKKRYGVDSLSVRDTTNRGVNLTYEYTNPSYHKGGYGNLGFEEINITTQYTDEVGYTRTHTTFHQEANASYQLSHRPSRELSYASETGNAVNEQLLSDTRYRWKVRTFNDDIDAANTNILSPHYFTYLYDTSVQSWDLDGSFMATTLTQNYQGSNPTCAPLLLSDLATIETTGSDEEYFAQGVLKYSQTMSCDNNGTSASATFESIEIASVIDRGNKIGLIESQITRSGAGSTLSNALSSTFDVRSQTFSYFATGELEETIAGAHILEAGYQQKTAYTYNVYGSVATVTKSWDNLVNDGLGFSDLQTQMTESFNSQGERQVITNVPALGSSTAIYHRVFGGPIFQTDVNGLQTTTQYDFLGRTINVESPGNLTTQIDYRTCTNCFSSYNNQATWYTQTKSEGSTAVRTYHDAMGRSIGSRATGFSGEKVYTTQFFNAYGKVIKSAQPFFNGQPRNETFSFYDVLGRVERTRLPDLTESTQTYNGFRTVTSYEGQNQTQLKNSKGWVMRSWDNAGTPVEFTYNGLGQVLNTIVDADTQILTTMAYDPMGRQTLLSDPDVGEVTTRYNGIGLLAHQTDNKGQVTRHTYDAAGRTLTRMDDATGNAKEQRWVYNSAFTSLATSLSGKTTAGEIYTESYHYTPLGLPDSVTTQHVMNGTSKVFTVQNRYDNFLRPLSVTYPGNYTVATIYSERGHLEQVVETETKQPLYVVDQVNALGQVKESRTGDGSVTQKEYYSDTNRLGRIQTLKDGLALMDQRYEYNDIGNLTHRTDHANTDGNGASVRESFCYDNLNRLKASRTNGCSSGDQDYGYDALGNIRFKKGIGSYSYTSANGAGPHAVTNANSLTYHYDANGSLTEAFDASNSLKREVRYSSFNKPTFIRNDVNTVQLTYGPNKNRVRRVDSGGNGKTTYYAGNLYEESTYNGLTHKIYYIGDFALNIRIESAGTEPEEYHEYLHRDHLGSVVARSYDLTPSFDNIPQAFDAWGLRLFSDWSGLPEGSDYKAPSVRGFTNHEHLDSVGLIHMNGRVYDPELGRFLSADPLVQAPLNTQSYNRYSYTFNNPLRYTDPTGYYSAYDTKTKQEQEEDRRREEDAQKQRDKEAEAKIRKWKQMQRMRGYFKGSDGVKRRFVLSGGGGGDEPAAQKGGNPVHDPKSGPYEVEVPDDVKTALSITLGVDASDVSNVKVIANSRWANFLNWGNKLFGGPGIAATTLGKNRILLPSHTSPDFFFNTPSLILHEYFHVFTQWNTGQMNVFNYLMNPNKWEGPAYGYGDSARNQSTYNRVRYFSQ